MTENEFIALSLATRCPAPEHFDAVVERSRALYAQARARGFIAPQSLKDHIRQSHAVPGSPQYPAANAFDDARKKADTTLDARRDEAMRQVVHWFNLHQSTGNAQAMATLRVEIGKLYHLFDEQ